MQKFLSSLLIFGLSLGLFAEVQGKVINCYWGTWAYYRNSKGRFDASNINPNLCTHLSYSFFGITEAGSFRFLDSWLDIDLNNLNKAVALKQTNRNLKLLASIGGWNEGSTKYSQMAGDPVKRRTFVESTVAFMDEYGFDGISLDWEYPNQRGGVPADKQNLIQLLKELKEAFRPKGRELFIAVAAAEASASLSYDIPEICKYVDFINIMTYDFNGSWDPVIGINAPLQGFGQNNVAASIDYWLRSGATAQKILLGIASYGRTFRLANTAATTPGSPSAGAGNPGLYTQEAGFWSYYEICEQFSQNVWEIRWDQVAYAPYAFRGNQWVGYENVESVNAKIDYMNSLDLGGAFLWSIESDDFNNVCGDGRYPLLTAVNNRMFDESMPSTTTVTTTSPTTETTCLPASTTTTRPTTTTALPTTTTGRPTTTTARTTTTTALPTTTTVRPTTTTPRTTTTTTPTPSPPTVELCTVDGWYRHESDCTRFYRCIAGKRYDFQCRPGLLYDNSIRSCNFPSLVNCNA